MTNHLHALTAAMLGAVLLASSSWAQSAAPFKEAPFTSGFWSFPIHKANGAAEILAHCRAHFEIRFPDGHFIDLRMTKTEGRLVQREVEKVGYCVFSATTQVERCEIKITNADGSVLVGTTENKFVVETENTLKVTVVPKMITDSPVGNTPFDIYPVRCPERAIWSILNKIDEAK